MKYLIFFFLFIFVHITLCPQHNTLINRDIYDFLDRCEISGIITINHHQKPYSREIIYKKLLEINKDKSKLSELMQVELEFYLSEFKVNFNDKTVLLGKNQNNAYRFFEYSNSDFGLTFYPEAGVKLAGINGRYNHIYYNGFSTYGYAGKNFTYDFDYNDISIKRASGNRELPISPERGMDYAKYFSSTRTSNYDRTMGNVSLNFKQFRISLSKQYNYWGTGYEGYIILSDKAPSFPHLSIKITPVDWLDFNYFYGSLNSMYYDSTTIRNQGELRPHISLIEKYIAAHILTIDLFENLKISLGESVIISDRFEPIYLIPVLFFRIADHYLSKSDYNSGNAQIFGSTSLRIPDVKTRFDFSFFIDEMNITNKEGPTSAGYSFGATVYDPIIKNTGLQIEYVRINPFVYTHSDPLQWYSNRNYNLGHWLGNNSDKVMLKFYYKPIALFNLIASYCFIRRGSIEQAGDERYNKDQKFLYGNKSFYSLFKVEGDYQLINNFYLNFEVSFSNAWGKNNLILVEDYKFKFLSAGFSYGFD